MPSPAELAGDIGPGNQCAGLRRSRECSVAVTLGRVPHKGGAAECPLTMSVGVGEEVGG